VLDPWDIHPQEACVIRYFALKLQCGYRR